MATMGMALAVLDHAETYSDVEGWHAVSDFWTADDILHELHDLETTTGLPLLIDAAAIAHFTSIANPLGRQTRH